MGDFNSRSLIITVLLVIIALFSGMFLGRYSKSPQTQPVTQVAEQKPTKGIFDIQTATIQGEITKVSSSTLSVKNDKGQTGEFPISNKVVIYKFKSGSSQASASADVKSIEVNQKALINLNLVNGQYQVTSISYLPPTSATPTR